MPYGKKRSYSKGRRNAGRRNQVARRKVRPRKNTSVQRGIGMSDSQIVKLRYSETIDLDPGAGLFNTWAFSANNPVDLNVTGAGHQPLYWDEMAALYQHYIVLGSKITVRFQNQGVAGSDIIGVGIQLMDNASNSWGGYDQFVENGKGSHGTIGPFGGPSKLILKSFYSPRKMFGIKDVEDFTNLRALVSAAPAEDAVYVIGATSLSGGDPTGVLCHVVIDLVVKFSERALVASS